jgi:hypothetical protein
MAGLGYSEEVIIELDALWTTHEAEAALIDALLEQLDADDDMLGRLSDETPLWHFNYVPSFEIKRFAACWDIGRRVYILKPYQPDGELSNFRVLMGHDIETDEYFVLSAAPRSISYDTTSQNFRNVCDRYDRLNIPSIRPSR